MAFLLGGKSLSRIFTRRFLYALLAASVLACALLAWGLSHLSKELEARFYETFDSIPTKVYSAPFWFREGVSASAEELRYRLKEREYKEIAAGTVPAAPGQFSLEVDEQKRPARLLIFTADFPYPALAKEALFGDAAANTAPKRLTVSWRDGVVSEVLSGETQVLGEALEPVLVAQLNEGNIQARKTIPIGDIPHTLMKGIVLTEDQRFLEHIGVDPRGILRSIYVNLRSGGYVQGASTITQQLARNIYLTRQKTIWRKIKEMVMSVLMELKFSKDQILEKYLNEVYFGQSGNIAIHGVSEAAKFYFDKKIEDLSISEQALLAGIVRGPFYYSPYRHLDRAKGRQEIVLTKMFEAGVITEAQYKAAKLEPLKFARVNPVQNRAPYFTDMVQAQILKDLPEHEVSGAGLKIFSTLDTYYQALAEQAVASGVGDLEARLKQYLDKKKKPAAPEGEIAEPRLLQGVFIAVDPASGHLLSLVGGRSYEESTYNRALLMRRQIGSLVKPFVFLSALMHGKDASGNPLSAISKFEDKPFTYEYDRKVWSPRNYEKEFAGTVTMRYALAHSINTVAAQVAIATGLDNLVAACSLAGFESITQPLPSLSLGAVEVPPLEVASAYTTLANFGLRREITSTLAVVGEGDRPVGSFRAIEQEALPPPETANVVEMMTTTFESGTARAARTGGFSWAAAGKTGTTNDFRDAWFAGFTKKLLAVSWVGFDRDDEVVRKHRTALKLTGAVAALPVWTQFMKDVHKDQDSQPLAYPDGALRTIDVDLISGKRANQHCLGASVVQETFTSRNIPSEECN
jgi:penicillin-binding protein 1B